MDSFDFLNRTSSDYIEHLYQQYQKEPRSLDEQWRAFFAGLELASDTAVSSDNNGAADSSISNVYAEAFLPGTSQTPLIQGVYALVHMYREMGHFIAKLDPLGNNRTTHPLLKLSEFGLGTDDLDKPVGNGGFRGETDGTLRDLLNKLRLTYCGSIGVEYTNIADPHQRTWLEERMEPIYNNPPLDAPQSRGILNRLIEVEDFENFLQTKYLGQKRFSIEGGESLLPMLDNIIDVAADRGAEKVVMGMAHRGRLNVLAHILGKPYELILSEFEGSSRTNDNEGDGDVKYHMGYSNDRVLPNKRTIHISLCDNPSHLELVDPVIQGMVRAKQEYSNDTERNRVIPILIHGEAAFTGQGVVSETLSLSELWGYDTGGTIHIIINNQLGYTATPQQTRFTPYPTDVAKMIQAPVFHVNADDPQACVHAARMAMEFRQQFKVDVMIDLVCYRRYGHNETDDPMFTQPLMYKLINDHPTVTKLYGQDLLETGVVTAAQMESMHEKVRHRLEAALKEAKEVRMRQHISSLEGRWSKFKRPEGEWPVVETGVPIDTLKYIGEKALRVPPGFSLYRKLTRLLKERNRMIGGEQALDWGCAEMLAYGSLLLEGYAVRLTGQDVERGTFSHRHAVWHDTDSDEIYIPLKNIDKNQANFTIINTMLSELAVIGFEYGMSLSDPYLLNIWEAQFGDFINGAQAIVDEFISSGETKWKRMSGFVMLLPHGYEGQGPDHSSGRLERFLQLSADDNMQVCYPTTPANFFHMIRQQMKRSFRKPLIVMSPKSLLRHKKAVSKINEFTTGSFQPVLDDPRTPDRSQVKQLVFCTGKIYYELEDERANRGRDDMAIVRLEQLHPFPTKAVQNMLNHYRSAQDILWVQEEPQNMGSWAFVAPRLRSMLSKGMKLKYRGREDAASPANGSHHIHVIEQKELLRKTFEEE